MKNSVSENPQDKDQVLWTMAKKRAKFKKHLFTYLIINVFLWVLWALPDEKHVRDFSHAWPIWVTIGWGIGLAFDYFDSYHGTKDYLVQKEYDKLKKQK